MSELSNIFTDKDSFSVLPSKEKLTSKELIVIVQSRPNAFEARQATRDTWAKTGTKKLLREKLFYNKVFYLSIKHY